MSALYTLGHHALLPNSYWGLKDITLPDTTVVTGDQQRAAIQIMAEHDLDLKAPAYTDATVVEMLTDAIVLQIAMLLRQGIDPLIFLGVTNTITGATTATNRNRTVHPGAANLRDRATGRKQVAFEPRGMDF